MSSRLRFPRRALALAAALAGTAALAQQPPPSPREGPAPPFAEFHERIRQARVGALPLGAYHLAKAQAWVDAATDAHHLGDRGAGSVETLAEADRLLRRLAAGEAAIPLDTPPIPGSARLREDLWQRAGRIKADPGFRCAQAETARFEVMLAVAGHIAAHSGWRSARHYVQAAERLGREAQDRQAECPVPQPVPPAAASGAGH